MLVVLANSWVICGIGTLFCGIGVYQFHKKAYEEGESMFWPVVLMVMGVVLIGFGTARHVGLIS